MNKVRTGLRLPIEMNTKLILKAEELCVSKNALILFILKEWADRNDIKGARND